MQIYLDSLKYVMDHGEDRPNRTGVDTRAVFGEVSMEFDLREGFPAMTTKKLYFKPVLSELLWFLEGSQDERRLAEILHGSRDPEFKTIWTANANSPLWKDKADYEGDCGRIYGAQWRNYRGRSTCVDQVSNIVKALTTTPYDRRIILSAWNPAEVDDAALPPCHTFSHYFVSNNKELDCLVYIRSNDALLGCAFNIASYALLTCMFAHVCNLKPRFLHYKTGDYHIYLNHFDAVAEQLSRKPYPLPTLWLNPEVKDIFSFTMEDAKLINYKCHPPIKAEMAI